VTVQIKSGGAWRTATNGGIRMRNGGAWRVANGLYIKSGGVWRDSGYRGYPNPPGTPSVSTWDNTNFASCTCAWSAPAAGGAPTVSYDVYITNQYGNAVVGPGSVGNVLSYAWGTGMDSYYIFYVRSVSAGGLTSGWVSGTYARPLMGHTQLSHVVTDNLTRPWTSYSDFPNGLHRNEVTYIYVPASVYMTQWRFHLGLNFPGPYISKPPAQGNRQIYYWSGGAGWDTTPWDISGSTYDDAIGIANVNGQNLNWGIGVQGIGWSAAPSNTQLLIGTIYLDGNENYTQDRTVIDRNYQGNQYW
jgi:hypothetical protein